MKYHKAVLLIDKFNVLRKMHLKLLQSHFCRFETSQLLIDKYVNIPVLVVKLSL